MFNKRYFFILLLFIIAIGTIASVSASDINETTDIATLSKNADSIDKSIALNEDDSSSNLSLLDDVRENRAITSDLKNCTVESASTINLGDSKAIYKLDSSFVSSKKSKVSASSSNSKSGESKNYNITVRPKYVVLKPVKLTTYYNSDKKFSVKVVNGVGAPVKEFEVIFKVYTGSKYKKYSAYSNSKGIARISVKSLSVGSHKVVVSAGYGYCLCSEVLYGDFYKKGDKFGVKLVDGDGNPIKGLGVQFSFDIQGGTEVKSDSNGIANFSFRNSGYVMDIYVATESVFPIKSKVSYIKITKNPLQITTKSISTSKSGAVHIKVVDKATKKPVNGVKLIVKVYTGSRYRTFSLVTGYDGKIYKSNGVVAIESNQFSVGHHKVAIAISSSSYKGSATAYLKILPSVKNYAKYTGVVSNGKARRV